MASYLHATLRSFSVVSQLFLNRKILDAYADVFIITAVTQMLLKCCSNVAQTVLKHKVKPAVENFLRERVYLYHRRKPKSRILETIEK